MKDEILESFKTKSSTNIQRILRKNNNISLSDIILLYKKYCTEINIKENREFIEKIKLKPIRTLSGVVPVTVLTKPFPCPGKCIFCPNDTQMPKSYLSKEPGAMRALMNKFDPYTQVKNRIQALQNIGHKTEKIELLILGGTFSVYPRNYQEWFIKRCIEAMNNFQYEYSDKKFIKNEINFDVQTSQKDPPYNWNIKSLIDAQKINENSNIRCIGITIETRPDRISENETIHLRTLGATKIQLGIQSTNDEVLKANNRGEKSSNQKKAIAILRSAGFKIQIHWMPNLYKSTPKKDIKDIQNIYYNKSYMPDEIKIYPCSIIDETELFEYYKKGKYKPYSEKDLIDILIYAKKITPRYVRINRLIRDIPSTYIEDGNKKTNLRQIVQNEMGKQNLFCQCIRCREIKNDPINKITYEQIDYKTDTSLEKFLSFNTKDKILGFLRLSLPDNRQSFIDELGESSIIREVHVYGLSLGINDNNGGVQHLGIGKKLIKKAEEISKEYNFKKISVISGIGTREYYKKRGFIQGNLYQSKLI
ncbi:tRNA uridine(34) 5-carboxymethylaminomethyl modification radical SAM/GNAT enzyme Elp3 [Patescibacteria group bacterium]|nr:tRNA uridine(34) 5-carboxymethylaminomethyl modification radical SAM/GNAT enzyme Elp3 [Patescibacteria group bacterium]